MDSPEIRQRFLKFFESRGHKIVPSSSLISTDPSVLLTTAGMQQFKPYFTGQKDPMADFGSKNTTSIQKSFRTSDIDEVGDESHLTFFEMLGNFSFGGYWKEYAIKYAHEFITKEMNLAIDYVSVFKGDAEVPADVESETIWKFLGVMDVKKFGREDNFWGPTGVEGPCGPTTEIYVNGIEVWNIVFNEYYMKPDRTLEPLPIKGVDTGMGLERLAMSLQGKKNIFETDLFESIIQKIVIPRADRNSDRSKRIIADHIRAIAFLISDGVRPSNKDAGYILRRLLRRVMVYGAGDTSLLSVVVNQFGDFYNELKSYEKDIVSVTTEEYIKFSSALKKGLNELDKLNHVDAEKAFWLYESFGLPYEVIKDFNQSSGLTREQFDQEFKKHQEISRSGAEKKFGGHGIVEGDLMASNPEELKIKTRLHTATHLLNAALHKVLGSEVSQRGSDISAERTRFDFVFGRKMTPEEIKQVEDLVNQAIAADWPVKMEVMPLEEAKKSGAFFFYKGNYPEQVKVYSIGPNFSTLQHSSGQAGSEPPFSRELCGGPHVARTGEIGRFRIVKEESSSAGVRRIRAVIE